VQVRTRHTPGFGVARLLLAPAEPVQVQPGAMLATSYGVAIEAKPRSSLLKSLTRSANPPPVSVFTAPAEGGWVDVVPSLPGDLHVLELDGSVGWCVARNAWLALAGTAALDTQWAGFRVLLGSDEGFLAHLGGTGAVVLACYGALDVVTLRPGDFITVHPGHVVGFADAVQSRLRAVNQGGTQSVRTGEGLVFDFAGPGIVLTQTRNPRGLVGWLGSNGLVSGKS
jgi:uncharacterized protein (TIGR00266 family)